MKFPLASMWLVANERKDIKTKVAISRLTYAIAESTPHQRWVGAYQLMAEHYARERDDR